MVDGEMPCAAASFLKVASHGSNGAVLRQFAWPNADVGAAINTRASTAHVDRVVCMVTVRIGLIGLATFAALASRLATALLARGMATRLSCLDRVLIEGSPEKAHGPLSVGAWS